MLRVVVDPGVLIAALISQDGAPAQLLTRWFGGQFQIVTSPELRLEFLRVTSRPKFRAWFSIEEAREFDRLIEITAEGSSEVLTDAALPSDDGDGYLVHLTVSSEAFALVTGDKLLASHQTDGFRALSPREFVALLDRLETTFG